MCALRVGVVGLGSMGQRHLATLARLSAVQVTAVVSGSAQKRALAEERYGVKAVNSVAELPRLVDAAVVAVPTVAHAEVASFLLRRGLHLLVEKPLTATVAEAEQLVALARAEQRVLMVGHIERFNPAYLKLQEVLQAQGGLAALAGEVAIKAWRMGPFDGRASDVGVELDLLIHDVDAVAGLLPGRTLLMQNALGMRLVTGHADIVTASFTAAPPETPPAVRAVLLASRMADAKRRGLRIEHPRFQAELDFMNQELAVASDNGTLAPVPVEKAPPLDFELAHFVECVQAGRDPLVNGEAGLRALQLCLAVQACVAG